MMIIVRMIPILGAPRAAHRGGGEPHGQRRGMVVVVVVVVVAVAVVVVVSCRCYR